MAVGAGRKADWAPVFAAAVLISGPLLGGGSWVGWDPQVTWRTREPGRRLVSLICPERGGAVRNEAPTLTCRRLPGEAGHHAAP